MEADTARSGIFLVRSNVPGVAGALLLPRIWPKITISVASVSEEGRADRNTKEASKAQIYEVPSFPGLGNTLEMSWL